MDPAAHKYSTYHCICGQFILASTRPLESYRQRSGDALDQAYILPVSEQSPKTVIGSESSTPRLNELSVTAGSGNDNKSKSAEPSRSEPQLAVLHTTSIVLPNPKMPIIVMRSDGFEPRYQMKCARCDLTIGYQLDKSLYGLEDGNSKGPRRDVLYVIPGSLKKLE